MAYAFARPAPLRRTEAPQRRAEFRGFPPRPLTQPRPQSAAPLMSLSVSVSPSSFHCRQMPHGEPDGTGSPKVARPLCRNGSAIIITAAAAGLEEDLHFLPLSLRHLAREGFELLYVSSVWRRSFFSFTVGAEEERRGMVESSPGALPVKHNRQSVERARPATAAAAVRSPT